MISPELTRFLRYVQQSEAPLPASLCDAADILDTRTDAELALICGANPGPVVRAYQPSLRYSCELRKRIAEEIDEEELNLPESNAEGWLRKLARAS